MKCIFLYFLKKISLYLIIFYIFFFFASFDWFKFYMHNLFVGPISHFLSPARMQALNSLFLVFYFNLVTRFINKKPIHSVNLEVMTFYQSSKSRILCPLWALFTHYRKVSMKFLTTFSGKFTSTTFLFLDSCRRTKF